MHPVNLMKRQFAFKIKNQDIKDRPKVVERLCRILSAINRFSKNAEIVTGTCNDDFAMDITAFVIREYV